MPTKGIREVFLGLRVSQNSEFPEDAVNHARMGCRNANPLRNAATVERNVRIIIPAHDEAARLEETVSRLWHHFGARATILVVANGCTDNTSNITRQLARRYPTVELLEITKKIGKGGAVRAGLTLGSEPYVAFVDADGSTAADQLEVLLEACIARGLSGTIGSRWMTGSRIARKQPLQRRLASRAFNSITRFVFGLDFTDTQCGAKVFKREAIDGILDRLEIANFAFDVDVLLSLKRLGKPVAEIPICWEDVTEYSKVRLVTSGPPMLWALLRLYVKDSVFRRLPFLDILGLSETIPVRFGLDMLFLFPRHHKRESTIEALIETVRERGHTARVVRFDGAEAIVRFALWYLRRGHLQSDVIVHGFGRLGTALLKYSRKPKYAFEDLNGKAQSKDFSTHFIADVTSATNSLLYFRRNGDAWNLAAQRLETSHLDECF